MGTDGVRCMVPANNLGTSWVLSSVGILKCDKKKVYQVAGIGM